MMHKIATRNPARQARRDQRDGGFTLQSNALRERVLTNPRDQPPNLF
jgi:hypothetical protein